MKNVLLIINPVAGTLRARGALFDIIAEFCKAGYTVTTQLTQHRRHARELAADAQNHGYDLVVCCGGDGTLNETVSGLVESGSSLPLGYIPAGSTNDFADTLGLSTIPKEAAKAIIQCRTPFATDIGQFADDRYFTYIASFGAFTSTSYSVPQDLKNKLGHVAYVLQAVKDLAEIRSHRVKVECFGEYTAEYSGDYLFGSISNTTSVAGIVKLKPHMIDLQDGLFEVVLIKKPADIIDLNDILTGIMASDFSSPMFEYFKASELRFTMSKSVKWSLDGEKADGMAQFTVRNLKRAVTLYK